MMKNRSVPADIMLSHVVCQDVDRASAWLAAAFGFVEQYRYGNPVSGAQMMLGRACIMLRAARPGEATPKQLRQATQSLTIFVEDVSAHLARALAAGAKIVEELNETCYGERQYGAEDPDGHHWLFSQHAHDVNPADWGASVTVART
jgi:uncharacterized glyoxalase superfamily protein PhnB